MKTLSALVAATALTFASVAGAAADGASPLLTHKSTHDGPEPHTDVATAEPIAIQPAAPAPAGATLGFGGLGVGATAGLVVASALIIGVVLDDDTASTTTSSTN
jgi:hypothetical protein